MDITHKFASLSHLGNNFIIKLEVLHCISMTYEDVVRFGGDVTVIHLPEIGIYGNTHFPMSDLNNTKIAEIMAKWLERKGLNN